MNNYLSTLPSYNRDIVIIMNTLCCYNKSFNFKHIDENFGFRIKYNDVLSGSGFVKVNFTANQKLFGILVSKDNFYDIVSVTNGNLNSRELPQDLLFQLGEFFLDLIIFDLLNKLEIDVNFVSFENIEIDDLSKFPIGMVFYCENFFSFNMIVDADLDVLDLFCKFARNSLSDNFIELPDIPIVSRLVLGSTNLKLANIMPGSLEIIKKGDVLVILNDNSGMNNLFVSIFDHFFYPAYLTDDSIVTIEKIEEILEKNNTSDLIRNHALSKYEDVLEDYVEDIKG